jgi:hydroxymethylglutaryl-CoA lyase
MEEFLMQLPAHVYICEVAPRDGFQSEAAWIPTEQKINFIRQLASTGIKQIEVSSFVHPKAIPQLRDAEEVVKQVQDLTHIKFRALIPNLTGAQRAISAGVKKFKLMLSATDSHSLSNANRKVRDAQEAFLPIVDLAEKNKVGVGGSISVAFGCPYEGKVPVENLISIIERYQAMGIKEVSLADTTGMANPKQVQENLQILRTQFPEVIFTMHLHNTRGLAFANAYAALTEGIVHFDASIAGLGGCPYAPGATGNIATEDLVHACEEMGVRAGIDLDNLLIVAQNVKDYLGHDGGSFLLKAGPSSRTYDRVDKQQKVE